VDGVRSYRRVAPLCFAGCFDRPAFRWPGIRDAGQLRAAIDKSALTRSRNGVQPSLEGSFLASVIPQAGDLRGRRNQNGADRQDVPARRGAEPKRCSPYGRGNHAPTPRSIFLIVTAAYCPESAQRARNDGEIPAAGIARDVAFSDIRERPDDDLAAVIREQFGAMAFKRPPKNRFRNNVSTMSSRWWPRAIFVQPSQPNRYKRATPQPSTAAHRAPFRDHTLYHAVGVLLDDPVGTCIRCRYSATRARETRLLLSRLTRSARRTPARCVGAKSGCRAACRSPCARKTTP